MGPNKFCKEVMFSDIERLSLGLDVVASYYFKDINFESRSFPKAISKSFKPEYTYYLSKSKSRG